MVVLAGRRLHIHHEKRHPATIDHLSEAERQELDSYSPWRARNQRQAMERVKTVSELA